MFHWERLEGAWNVEDFFSPVCPKQEKSSASNSQIWLSTMQVWETVPQCSRDIIRIYIYIKIRHFDLCVSWRSCALWGNGVWGYMGILHCPQRCLHSSSRLTVITIVGQYPPLWRCSRLPLATRCGSRNSPRWLLLWWWWWWRFFSPFTHTSDTTISEPSRRPRLSRPKSRARSRSRVTRSRLSRERLRLSRERLICCWSSVSFRLSGLWLPFLEADSCRFSQACL